MKPLLLERKNCLPPQKGQLGTWALEVVSLMGKSSAGDAYATTAYGRNESPVVQH
jgi:hypothetical protein